MRAGFARPGIGVRQSTLGAWGADGAVDPDALAPLLAREVARAHALAPARVEVAYRRYTTLKSTARIAPDGRLVVCLSDGVQGAPPESQAAIAHVLAARVLRRKPPAWAEEAYGSWLSDPTTRELSLAVRKARARRHTLSPQGRHHDLAQLIEDVAATLFAPPLAPPTVGWTRQAGRAVLASFDEAHEVITVSRLLDHARVGQGTLRYLLYHELLHFEDFLRERARGEGAPAPRRRRTLHPRSFRERLHRFPGWQGAEADLARACRRRAVD